MIDNRPQQLNCKDMAEALTAANKKVLAELLQTGRWGNKSEIIRYGLHLVKKEVENEARHDLSPYPRGLLAKAYGKLTKSEREEEAAMAKASSRHKPKEP